MVARKRANPAGAGDRGHRFRRFRDDSKRADAGASEFPVPPMGGGTEIGVNASERIHPRVPSPLMRHGAELGLRPFLVFLWEVASFQRQAVFFGRGQILAHDQTCQIRPFLASAMGLHHEENVRHAVLGETGQSRQFNISQDLLLARRVSEDRPHLAGPLLVAHLRFFAHVIFSFRMNRRADIGGALTESLPDNCRPCQGEGEGGGGDDSPFFTWGCFSDSKSSVGVGLGRNSLGVGQHRMIVNTAQINGLKTSATTIKLGSTDTPIRNARARALKAHNNSHQYAAVTIQKRKLPSAISP